MMTYMARDLSPPHARPGHIFVACTAHTLSPPLPALNPWCRRNPTKGNMRTPRWCKQRWVHSPSARSAIQPTVLWTSPTPGLPQRCLHGASAGPPVRGCKLPGPHVELGSANLKAYGRQPWVTEVSRQRVRPVRLTLHILPPRSNTKARE